MASADNRETKMLEISRYRQGKRELQQGLRCCKDGDLRLIVTHGSWTDDADHFELNPGYKVIMICQPGKILRLNKQKIDTLKMMYSKGETFFANNDNNPDTLSPEGREWLKRVTCPCIARLYIGGRVEVGGLQIMMQVPNISLVFGGSRVGTGHCDNMDNSPNPTYENDTECRITCVPKEEERVNSERDFCEKYYFDADSSREEARFLDIKPFGPHYDPIPSISLQTLLNNEGPGTYFVVSCMAPGAGRELSDLGKQLAQMYLELGRAPAPATFDQDYERWFSGVVHPRTRAHVEVWKQLLEAVRKKSRKRGVDDDDEAMAALSRTYTTAENDARIRGQVTSDETAAVVAALEEAAPVTSVKETLTSVDAYNAESSCALESPCCSCAPTATAAPPIRVSANPFQNFLGGGTGDDPLTLYYRKSC